MTTTPIACTPHDVPPSPGWYRHPQHDTVECHWDGARWTGEHRFTVDEPAADSPDPEPDSRQRLWCLAICALFVALGAVWASGTASGPEPILLILLVAGSGGLLAPASRWMPAAAAVAGFVVAYVLEGLSQCPIDILSSCKADAGEAVLYAIVGACVIAITAFGGQRLRRWLYG